MPGRSGRAGDAAVRSTNATYTASWPAGLPEPWVTRLTCPACQVSGALCVFDGVGGICWACGHTIRDEGEENL